MHTEGAVIRKRSWWIELLMISLSDTVYAQILTFHLPSYSGKKENMGVVSFPLTMQAIKPYRTHMFSPRSLTVDGTVDLHPA